MVRGKSFLLEVSLIFRNHRQDVDGADPNRFPWVGITVKGQGSGHLQLVGGGPSVVRCNGPDFCIRCYPAQRPSSLAVFPDRMAFDDIRSHIAHGAGHPRQRQTAHGDFALLVRATPWYHPKPSVDGKCGRNACRGPAVQGPVGWAVHVGQESAGRTVGGYREGIHHRCISRSTRRFTASRVRCRFSLVRIQEIGNSPRYKTACGTARVTEIRRASVHAVHQG